MYYRWVGILFTILIGFVSWITDNPPNSIHWLYIGKMVRQPIIPIFGILIMSLSVSSLFLQLAFRLYLSYNVNNDFNAESNDIFQTKTLVIMLLFYVIAPLFRRLSQKLETPYFFAFFYIGQMVTIPTSIILTHQNTRSYLSSKYPKLSKSLLTIKNLLFQDTPHGVIE